MAEHGRLDVCVLNAGIGERGDLFDPGNGSWQKVLDVDLTAVIENTRRAVLCMGSSGGTIISVASAGGLFPMPAAPVYAASKAGVVHFTRSSAPLLAKRAIRLMCVCPEFVDTPLVRRVMVEDPDAARQLLGSLDISLLQPASVVAVIHDLMQPRHKGGTVAVVRQTGAVEYPFKRPASRSLAAAPPRSKVIGAGPTQAQLAAWARSNLPKQYKKIQVHALSSNFHQATRIVQAPLPDPAPGKLLLRRVHVGINASDINYTAGRYHASLAEAQSRLPFDAGFESVSIVVAVGSGVRGFSVGDPVATLSYDGFAEFGIAAANQALKVPRACPEVVALLTSGLTASIALKEAGSLKPGETVLVTAAAGGTGQFAVQLAKIAGCHVVATAGGADKAAMLKRLGVDRVVDYKKESLKAVLKAEYPRGIDVVYESVGGDMFSAALAALAPRGRLIIIGMMSAYQEGWPRSEHPGLPEKLLWKSASMIGFFLLRYAQHFKAHLAELINQMDAGKLQVMVDPRRFDGIEAIPAAVDHLNSGKSIGKVVVQLTHVPTEVLGSKL
ncbi:hypothetical protein DUNSADRAFT_15083 [Dunaliella salina]|uniref:Enoyl reductase (ER) domain-containing protein n=1 Tax=Dunaliella salina TaxID=3046 RepID=A0ABQ7G603_DUNSA|nr:hypothetical protein DUNSADRAFT_15083 [Dunaliella salina]|eukprot:KAF5830042.1 hypothetical protein DUNSADRAFT_15083 [Dunaliella salina]